MFLFLHRLELLGTLATQPVIAANDAGQAGGMVPAVTPVTSHHPAACLSMAVAVFPKWKFLNDIVANDVSQV